LNSSANTGILNWKSGSVWLGTHRVSNWLAATLLFLATAGFILWQNSQIAVLWDLSYLLDTSWRIALGQVPYRDFPLVHPPLTFLIQAAIMRLAGRVYGAQIAYAALVGGLGTVIAWRIIFRILREKIVWAWPVSLALAAPLCLLGVYSVYPHPIYDCDSVFAVLIAIYLLQRLSQETHTGWQVWLRCALTGASLMLPVLFKQNIGLPFLLAVVAGLFLLFIASQLRQKGQMLWPGVLLPGELLWMLTGATTAAALALLLIHRTAGLGNYFHWTVVFAGQRRLPALSDMLAVYRQPSFFWIIPTFGAGLLLMHTRWAAKSWARLLAFGLAAAPFIGSLIFLFIEDDLDERGDNLLALWPLLLLAALLFALAELRKGITLARLLPVFVLATIQGTFLSQQLWGSTYAIWPLLMILIAGILVSLPRNAGWSVTALAAAIGITFTVCGGLYAAGHERLNYIQLPDGLPQHATLPASRGMSTPGPFLGDFEELVRFADREIPAQDGILLLPGEEPFYFVTGRTPQFPVQIFDRTTDPYSPAELMQEASWRNIRWVIVKTRLQSNENPLPDQVETMRWIESDFRKYANLGGYAIYRHP
jgi:hypothetical protein